MGSSESTALSMSLDAFNNNDNNDTGNASFSAAAFPHSTILLVGSNSSAAVDDVAASEDDDRRKCVLASHFYIHGVVAGLLCATGIVSNGFSIAVLGRDRDASPVSSLLLRSLAAVDIFFLSSWSCAWTLFFAFEYFGDLRSYHVAYHYLRLYTYPLIFVGQMATIWTTVLIAASRFIAVSLPYYAPTLCTLRSTRHRVAGILVFCFVYNVPRLFEFRVEQELGRRDKYYAITEFGRSRGYQFMYVHICYYVFSFFLPLILLTTFNLRLIADYRRINRKRNSMLSSGRNSNREKHEQNVTLIMIIVIVVFVLCNSPARILQVIGSMTSRQPCPTGKFFLAELSSLLEVFNSTSNFFVYFIFRKQFRRILQREMCAAGTNRNRTGSTTALTIRLNGGIVETIIQDNQGLNHDK